MMKDDKFKLAEIVKMKMSDEKGIVDGIAHYLHTTTSYHVTYKDADGRQVSGWWSGGQLETVKID